MLTWIVLGLVKVLQAGESINWNFQKILFILFIATIPGDLHAILFDSNN
jgi:ABC-type uncharacterized transport system permease subunit